MDSPRNSSTSQTESTVIPAVFCAGSHFDLRECVEPEGHHATDWRMQAEARCRLNLLPE